MNNEAQKPLIHDQKDDAENGGSRLNNHHYIPREDFNDKDGSGGNSGNGGRWNLLDSILIDGWYMLVLCVVSHLAIRW